MKPSTALPQHDWLRRLIGEWTSETTFAMEPGKPPSTVHGAETVRALGDIWIILEGSMATPGGGHRSVITLGFDSAKNQFVGTFIGSMMTMIWPYTGELDAAEKTLTLHSEGPAMMPGSDPKKPVPYRDTIEIVSDDERIMRSSCPDEDGNWVTFMTMTYRRKS